MLDQVIVSVLQPLAVFGGIAGVIAAFGWARAERIRAAGRPSAPPQDAVLAELQALKQQIGEMQSTSHQFDLSFDEALTRLEQRVSRIETKTAVSTPEALNILKNGRQG